MEHEPTNHTERSNAPLTPDEATLARLEIEDALDKITSNNPIISEGVARLISASVHPGDGSVLEHFAATGRLNPTIAVSEVQSLIDTTDHVAWAIALGEYFESVAHPRPDGPLILYREPAPEVFLRSTTTGRSAWIEIPPDLDAFNNVLLELDPDSANFEIGRPVDRDSWQVGNILGFHDVDVSKVASLRRLHALARGIRAHGEGFAAYLQLFGLEYASRYTYKRLRLANFDNLTEMVSSFAFRAGILDGTDVPGEHRTAGPPVSVRLIERGLSDYYLWYQGRNRLHVFSRDIVTPSRRTTQSKE